MGKEVKLDEHISINSVDLSTRLRSVDLPMSTDEIDDTCAGSNSYTYIPGLDGARLSCEFAQDYAVGSVDATLWGVRNGRVAVSVAYRHSATDPVSATNPEYQFDVVMGNYNPVAGQVGTLMTATAEFVCTGDVTRATS